MWKPGKIEEFKITKNGPFIRKYWQHSAIICSLPSKNWVNTEVVWISWDVKGEVIVTLNCAADVSGLCAKTWQECFAKDILKT